MVEKNEDQEERVSTLYSVTYLIDNDKLLIPLSPEQIAAKICYIRKVDAARRVVIPRFMRDELEMKEETGYCVTRDILLLANHYPDKLPINQLGMVVLPDEIGEADNISECEFIFDSVQVICKAIR